MRNYSQAAKSAREGKITWQVLERLYVVKKLSLERVGRELGVSADTVRYQLKRYGLGARSATEASIAQRRFPPLSKSELRDRYERRELSLMDIARQETVTPVTVKNWLVRYGIPRRSQRDAALAALRRPEVVKRRLRSFATRPTRLELKLSGIIKKYNLPFRYVGDGALAIDGKCPDFVGTKDHRSLIEVFGRRWHYAEDEHVKRRFYEEHGYRLLVVWDRELEYPKREAADRGAGLVRRMTQFLADQPSS